jgi:activator of HSP90 ATPase
MKKKQHFIGRSGMPTRRQAILAGIFAIAGTGLKSLPAQTDSTKPETPRAESDKKRTFLHQEVEFNATPQRIYEILLGSKHFSAFSGDSAQISPEAGGSFSMFGGRIVGRNVELVPNQRIVQAWREAIWPPGVYSLVKFELKGQGSKTKVVLDHTGFAEGDFVHLNPGWKLRYWDPLEKYLGASAGH